MGGREEGRRVRGSEGGWKRMKGGKDTTRSKIRMREKQ